MRHLLLRALASAAASSSRTCIPPTLCPSRQNPRRFFSRPPTRRRKMAGERSSGRSLSSRGSPRIGEAVHVGKASSHRMGETSLSVADNRKGQSFVTTKSQDSPERVTDKINSGCPEGPSETGPFDICRPERGVTLSPSLLEINRQKRKEIERAKQDPQKLRLQPGLILLKNYIARGDQVEIIKECQKLGIGPGGFYRPGFRDGGKLNLRMMCLGRNWNPETRLYEDRRSTDGAEPPKIPEHFKKIVLDAMQTSHDLIMQQTGSRSAEEELPMMLPDLCIVNFYAVNGRLGLHQDRDETEESLRKGLPVVSFSLGDSADFSYGDVRDVEKAEKVTLESGDVLIFGGESRHIFHGVSCIHSNTAPKWLLDESRLKSGRLNLTFRQY